MLQKLKVYYIHCFAHQLQLTLVVIAKNDIHVGNLFNMLTILINIVGASCKRRGMLREQQVAHISEVLANGELISGHGCALDFIVEDGLNSEQRGATSNLLVLLQSFDFIFSMHLMKVIFGITNELSFALQRKEQDIVNAMQLVKLAKHRIQTLRDEG
ncbi:uncharacterized protein LOC141690625 [Apium graveolens]|uniref:uncharacterized protein LOC141690625 n=1 Tax=Apium graveolens TaxID=4045 RepID=UPI003D795270